MHVNNHSSITMGSSLYHRHSNYEHRCLSPTMQHDGLHVNDHSEDSAYYSEDPATNELSAISGLLATSGDSTRELAS